MANMDDYGRDWRFVFEPTAWVLLSPIRRRFQSNHVKARCIHEASVLTQLVIAFYCRRYRSHSFPPTEEGAECKGRAAGITILGFLFVLF
ncbi:unnamed protein product [Citrullus colocynthis]|uniref:Uncharacterized protein n=1 Tax=Citrullus colocynthis TaxID=252529 RepID=A0ABP0XSR6_9ROSI